MCGGGFRYEIPSNSSAERTEMITKPDRPGCLRIQQSARTAAKVGTQATKKPSNTYPQIHYSLLYQRPGMVSPRRGPSRRPHQTTPIKAGIRAISAFCGANKLRCTKRRLTQFHKFSPAVIRITIKYYNIRQCLLIGLEAANI